MVSPIFSSVTQGIRVSVRSVYSPDESSPRHNYFVFAYQVEITNESAFPVKLHRREWHIVDGIGSHRLVEGEGVVGQKPIMQPGESYQYVSGSHFSTAIGQMKGFYYMERLTDGAQVKVSIPPFVMVSPYLLN
ncbi:MAG: Co2+/Mg2+ efflux protein ApaG [Bacteroidota bacterium]